MNEFNPYPPTLTDLGTPLFGGIPSAGHALECTEPTTIGKGGTPAAAVVDPDFSGLVISPIKGQPDLLAELVADTFAFASSELLETAAAMWPVARDLAVVGGWHGLPGRGVATRTNKAIAGEAENRQNVEGSRARVEIAPGLVRIARRDEAKAERTRERLVVADIAARQHELEQLARPMALADLQPLSRGTRAPIEAWSRDSRARMIASICELDLAPIVSGSMLPCMVTLTLPGDWLAVAPDAATAARRFKNFTRAWEHKWRSPLVAIWKREFQDRGAPHWHLWTVPPVPMTRMREFKAWLSQTWTRVLFDATRVAIAVEHAAATENGKCSCSEVCRSLGAGTGVDFAEGLRARDPKRLAVYFLKESLGGEGKAYQNAAPKEWAGQSVGRFWGYRGIEKAVVAVPVDPGVDVQVLRVLRRWQRAQKITREVEVWGTRERSRKLRTALRASGEVSVRRLRRPAPLVGSAGWVAVNSGADLAAQLGRWASIVSERIQWERDGFAPDPGLSGQESVSWPVWAAHGPLSAGSGFPVPASR